MFDIGTDELLLVLVIGLVVLGPERLPIAVRTIAGWVRTLRALAASAKNELSQELQGSLKQAENAGLQNFVPELTASVKPLKEATETIISSCQIAATPDSGVNQAAHHATGLNSSVALSRKASSPAQFSDGR